MREYKIELEILLTANEDEIEAKIAEFYLELEKLDRDLFVGLERVNPN